MKISNLSEYMGNQSAVFVAYLKNYCPNSIKVNTQFKFVEE